MGKMLQLIVAHFTLVAGLILLLYAYPLVFVLMLYTDYGLIDIFNALGIQVGIRAFLILPFVILLTLTGFCLWRLPGKLLFKSSAWIQHSDCFLAFIFAALAPLSGLFALMFVFLMYVLVAAFDTQPPDLSRRYYDIAYVLIHTSFALGQSLLAFWVARFYWRLLQSTRANRAAENP